MQPAWRAEGFKIRHGQLFPQADLAVKKITLTTLSSCVCRAHPPFTGDIPGCLRKLCLHFAFFSVLLFKNQSPATDRPQETGGRIIHPSPRHPPALSYTSLFSPLLLPSLPLSRLPAPPFPMSLAGESGFRMPDVLQSEPRQCKHSSLP